MLFSKYKLNYIIKNLENYKLNSNAEAKKVLEVFFKNFVNLSPNKNNNVGARHNYYSYLIQMLQIHNMLIKKDYTSCCQEILTLYHYENILQKRIYYNLIYLYNNYF